MCHGTAGLNLVMRDPAATFTSSEKEANFRIYIIPGQLARLALGVLARTAVNECLTGDDDITRSAALWAWTGG